MRIFQDNKPNLKYIKRNLMTLLLLNLLFNMTIKHCGFHVRYIYLNSSLYFMQNLQIFYWWKTLTIRNPAVSNHCLHKPFRHYYKWFLMFYKATIYYTPLPTPIEKALYYGRVYMVVLVTMVTPFTPLAPLNTPPLRPLDLKLANSGPRTISKC